MGLNSGLAFIGRIGSGDIRDYTAVGDVVNVAQRLQAVAEPGEILVSDHVYESVQEAYPDATKRVLTVKGRDEPVIAFALRLA